MSDIALRIQAIRTVLVVLIVLATFVALGLAIIANVHSPYNEERIAPIIAWVHGVRVFQDRVTGPLLCNIYGPAFYLLYLPATLFRHATQSLAFGTVWSLVLYSLPVFYYAAADRRLAPFRRLLPILCFFTLSLASYWPSQVMLAIHPDAAGCGLAGLGLCLVTSSKHLRFSRIAAGVVFCVAAMGCKQNAASVLPFFFALIWWRAGRKLAMQAFLLCIVVTAVEFSTSAVLFGGAKGIWFNNYIVPSRFDLLWSTLPSAVLSLYQSLLMPMILLVIIGSNEVSRNRYQTWKPHVALFSIALVIVSIFVSLPGYLVGGTGNTFAPAIYWTILLSSFWLRSLLLSCATRHLTMSAAGPLAFLLIVSVSTASLASRRPELQRMFRTTASTIVEEYSRQHPNEVYFPFNPVAVYYGTGKFYHSDWGLADRSLAGFSATDQEFHDFIPASRFIAYPVAPGSGPDYVLARFGTESKRTQLAGLDDFFVYPTQ